MVSTLTKKLIRDLRTLKAQVITIALVVSGGVAVFIGGFSTYDSLQAAQQHHYQQQQFADIFAFAKRVPNALIKRIEQIKGVSQVETRLVYDVIIELPKMKEPATGRFISIPKHHLPRLNRLYLRQGRLLSPGLDNNEVVVNETFAKAHHLKPGDKLIAILNGKREQLTIIGIALSPEFVYAIRAQDILPDDKHFGIFWVNYKTLASAFEMDGAFNSLVLKISKNISQQSVIEKLDALLSRYGGIGAFAKDAQMSNRFVSNELEQLEFIALVIPTIFIAVAAFLLNIVSSRLVNIQRGQVATLKAVGYKNTAIGWYYLRLVSVIIILGSILGIIFGIWMGQAMTSLYEQYFHFPIFHYFLRSEIPVIAIFISSAAAISGTIGSIRYVVKLPPAQAMRPQSPPAYSRTFIDKIPFMHWLTPSAKMILRYLSRQPIRSLVTLLGFAFAIAIIILGLFWNDSVHQIINTQFLKAEREHAVISFKDPVDAKVLSELQKLQGVLAVEGFRAVPVRMKYKHYRYDTALLGYQQGSKQRQILDEKLNPMQLSSHSLLLTDELAKRLHVHIGDKLMIEILEGKRPKIHYKVSGISSDYVGLNAYMPLAKLNQWMDDGEVVTNVNLLIDKYHVNELYKKLKGFPKIATVQMKTALIKTFNETFSRQLLVFTSFFAAFAILIAIGIVYNAARIALAERSWELASLRVLGFTRHEVFKFLMGGMVVELIIGIPLGFVFGFGLCYLVTFLIPTEFVRLPLFIKPETFGISLIVILLSSLITSLFIRQKIKYLNLIAVLKSFD